jgi:hypothetical protein
VAFRVQNRARDGPAAREAHDEPEQQPQRDDLPSAPRYDLRPRLARTPEPAPQQEQECGGGRPGLHFERNERGHINTVRAFVPPNTHEFNIKSYKTVDNAKLKNITAIYSNVVAEGRSELQASTAVKRSRNKPCCVSGLHHCIIVLDLRPCLDFIRLRDHT